MKRKVITKNNKGYWYGILITLLFVVFLSIGFSAFQNNLTIDNIGVNVQIDKDIRVTGVKINTVDNANSYYEEYNVSNIYSRVKLNSNSSYIIYDVEVSNLGNIPMAIRDISLDNSNLQYELLDYKLKDKVCVGEECSLGIKKSIKIKVSYKEGVSISDEPISFVLNFQFGRIFNVSYFDIQNSGDLPKEAIEGNTFKVKIISDSDYVLKVFMNNKLLSSSNYEYDGNYLKIDNVTGDIKIYSKLPICQRATYLHTEECVGSYCKGLGTTVDGKDIITYGSIGTSGVLNSGDAFDCEVNGDGIYDSTKERFYYLFANDDVSLLIYYSNVTLGEPSNGKYVSYDDNGENWNGPVSAILQLPTKEQWSNVRLINEKRALINEYGTNKLKDNHTLPSAFSYEKYAARLLSFNELRTLAGIYIPTWQNGELNAHLYLAENTNFTSKNTSNFDGYWLETPRFTPANYSWFFYATARRVHSAPAIKNDILGVRPVIEVYKSDIYY